MTMNEMVAFASVVISIGTNVALYVHLSSTMNSRFDATDRKFDSVERRLELIQGDLHNMDIRLTKLER
jgi:hypothetical protein